MFTLVDETELRASFVVITKTYSLVITALPIFILCLLFLKVEKKSERENNEDKKMHGLPFHRSSQSEHCTTISLVIVLNFGLNLIYIFDSDLVWRMQLMIAKGYNFVLCVSGIDRKSTV